MLTKPRQVVAAITLLAALGMTLWGVFISVMWLTSLPAALRSQHYVTTPGQLLTAYTPGCGGRRDGLDLSYTYQVRTRTYTGTTLGPDRGFQFWYPHCGKELIDQWKITLGNTYGRPITVFYDPAQPEHSALLSGIPPLTRPLQLLGWSALLWLATFVLTSPHRRRD